MNHIETAYKMIVGYAGKKDVVKFYVIKSPEDLDRLWEIKTAHEDDPDSLFVTVVRSRKPRSYNYNHYETPVTVDDSGTVTTEAEKSLMFKPAVVQQAASLVRTDVEKGEWARTNRFEERTCIWH